MNLRCFFGHKYEEMGRHGHKTYENETSMLPWKIETTFLLKCKKCGDLKSKTLEGLFVKNDDDEDDGPDDPKPPVLSPDDYYDLAQISIDKYSSK